MSDFPLSPSNKLNIFLCSLLAIIYQHRNYSSILPSIDSSFLKNVQTGSYNVNFPFSLNPVVNLPIAVHVGWVALTSGVVLAGSWKGMDEMRKPIVCMRNFGREWGKKYCQVVRSQAWPLNLEDLGSNPSSTTFKLCDPGQVSSPLWVSIPSSFKCS